MLVDAKELFAPRSPMINPAQHPDETFALYSVPAFDQGRPEILRGRDIGSAKQAVSPGDVLLSRIVPHIRRAWRVVPHGQYRTIASGEWINFRSSLVDPAFLSFCLITDNFHRQFMATVGGVGGSLLRAQRDQVARIGIPLPGPIEQCQIAAVLADLRSVALLEADAISQTKELKRSASQELFSRGLRGEQQRGTEIGPLPESWGISTLAQVCTMHSGGTPPKTDSSLWQGPIPWVSGKDLKTSRLRDVPDHISERAARQHSKIAPAAAVLVLVRGMGLAKGFPVSLIEKPMAFNQDLKALIPSGDIDSSFLLHVLTQCGQRMLRKVTDAAHGTKRLTQDDLNQFAIPHPSKGEQTQIAAIIDAMDQKIDLHKRKKALLDELFKSLLNGLMTGEICVTDLDLTALDHLNSDEPQPIETPA